MNQIMRVGKGVVFAFDRSLRMDEVDRMSHFWKEKMPDVPAFFVPEAQIVDRGEITMFEFTGDVTPTMIAEFQLWWKEANRA